MWVCARVVLFVDGSLEACVCVCIRGRVGYIHVRVRREYARVLARQMFTETSLHHEVLSCSDSPRYRVDGQANDNPLILLSPALSSLYQSAFLCDFAHNEQQTN